ncbi:DinB family protein [Pontibacter sp. JH31]|uniref:DinB family protein n=1 Tax=Pontibacter aquaedesilientis TaxID=2766980 RepID=A0ABR7XH59_9BACT|nr:DinB family protein [Pontibacter aquaedesilientis]MBD1397627.1 DinB family protein [Pontibacter aquaedesilientis]
MNPFLEAQYLKLEESRNRLLDELDGLDEDLLNMPPVEGKWSVNQIIAHLIQVEQLTNSYIQRKVQKQDSLENRSLRHSFRSLLLKLALNTGMKFKAPEAVANVPEKSTLSSLRNQWNACRYQLEDTLTELPPELMNKCVFKHPYAGPLSISQTLTFLQDHFLHHARQIAHLRQHLLR